MSKTKREGKIQGLLNNIDERVVESKNFPTRLIRSILQQLGLTLGQWTTLVHEWSHCKYTGIRNSPVERTNARGNMVKEITSDEATWNAVAKFLKVIRCVRFKARFELHFSWREPAIVEIETQNLPKPAFGEPANFSIRTRDINGNYLDKPPRKDRTLELNAVKAHDEQLAKAQAEHQ